YVSVARRPDNRLLKVSAESDDFFRSSETQLDGENSARVTLVRFRELPPGDYEIRAELIVSTGRTVDVAKRTVEDFSRTPRAIGRAPCRDPNGGDVRKVGAIRHVIGVNAIVLLATLILSTSFAAELPDSTRISVRLIGGIDSESAKVGQPLQFVVMNDVVVDDAVLIRRDTVVV